MKSIFSGFFLSLLLIQSKNVLACSVCFNNVENDPNIVALKWAMLFLFVLIGLVLAALAGFFLKIRKYEKLHGSKA